MTMISAGTQLSCRVAQAFPERLAVLAIVSLALSGCAGAPKVPQELSAPLQAVDCSRDACIDFIYLHGSARPYPEHREEFYAYIDDMHDWVGAELYARAEVHQGLLQQDRRQINPEPVKFYWGDMSADQFQTAEELLHWSSARKGEPGLVAGMVQKYFVLGMHDTFWIGAQPNKRTVHLALHELIQERLALGHQVVLLGHSAGAMAIQGYAMYHLPYLDPKEFVDFEQEPELKELFRRIPGPTCARALLESGLFEFQPDGAVTPRLERDQLPDMRAFGQLRGSLWDEKVRILPDFTRQYCMPEQGLRGIITYGHPGPVLEGTVEGKERSLFLLFLRYVLEQDLFWVNISHTNDPVGYALYDEADLPERLSEIIGMPVRRGGGFFASGAESRGASVITAHSWYWLKPHQFARTLAETYAGGYRRRMGDPGAKVDE
jgi:pimeloyl-ACP methyl ester carboxylesterase